MIKRFGGRVRLPWRAVMPGALILRYHRVSDLVSDPHGLAVTPRHFAEHLQIMRKRFRPTRLHDLILALHSGNVPRKAVVITIDDGYADNLYHAKPLLEGYEVPATVFVCTGYVGQNTEFWWDELERTLLQPGTLPKLLDLSINGNLFHWDLEDAANYSEGEFRRYSRWNVRMPQDPTSRHRLLRKLHDVLMPLSHQERWRVLDTLLHWSGAPAAIRPTHRPLAVEELGRLEQGDLVEIGAHSVTHPVLSQLPVAQQREEIMRSKAYLEKHLGSPVRSFAYPYGGPPTYSEETVSMLQEAGFESACSTSHGRVRSGADPFRLPRSYVGNWSGEVFEQQLDLLYRAP